MDTPNDMESSAEGDIVRSTTNDLGVKAQMYKRQQLNVH